MYISYIRKSRYDRDYNELSVEETLKRHRILLESFASSQGITIARSFEEVVSGESLIERPEMQKLLRLVEMGEVEGVLCVDPDRLSRGNSIDQGIITQTFKYTNTKIITPYKTYDPANEYDEEFFEFNLFMSRKEYMLINRRLERGRKRSAAEGRFMGSVAPFGYRIAKIKGDKGNTLEIDPEEAETVKYMFHIYIEQGLGFTRLAEHLNELHIPSRTGVPWSPVVVSTILRNIVYTGKIRCSYKKTNKKLVDGSVVKSRHYDFDCPVYEGRHPAIIDDDTFEKACYVRSVNRTNQTARGHQFYNVFSGIAYCAECGAKMTGASSGKERRIMCSDRNCHVMSSLFFIMEKAVKDSLLSRMRCYANLQNSPCATETTLVRKALFHIDSKTQKLRLQLQKALDFLEQGVYDIPTFISRRAVIETRLEEYRVQRDAMEKQLQASEKNLTPNTVFKPKIQHLFDTYDTLSAEEKHHMYKEILAKLTYRKDSQTRAVTIDLFPRL